MTHLEWRIARLTRVDDACSAVTARRWPPRGSAYPLPVQRLASWTWIVFVLFAVLAFLFGVFPGTWYDAGASDRDEQWLVTSYAVLAVVLSVAIALTSYRRGERWA